MRQVTGLTPSHGRPIDNDPFHEFLYAVQSALADALKVSGGKLFIVETDSLVDVYQHSFDDLTERQYHNCRCCHDFITRYGSLVTVDAHGKIRPALWNAGFLEVSHPYHTALIRLTNTVQRGKVVGQFLWEETMWGKQEAGGFSHLWAHLDKRHCWTRRDITASQAMAAKLEDFKNLDHALRVMPHAKVEVAVGMLQSGALHRGDKILPMAIFLNDAFKKTNPLRNTEQRNRALWQLVSSAGAGWCAPRSSVLGALVEDLQQQLKVSELTRRHNERMDPTKYQRPSAPTSAGNVEQAERLIEQLGIASSLRRRFAAADELVTVWEPAQHEVNPPTGMFGHLLANKRVEAEAELTAKPITMTFAKFRRDILPHALEMEVIVGGHSANFCAFTTAADASAPPILKWDSEECRNPFG